MHAADAADVAGAASKTSSAYPAATPDSLDLILPLPPSSARVPRTPFPTKDLIPPPLLRSMLPAALSPRPLCYPSPRILSDRTCSSVDASGDSKAQLYASSQAARGGASDLEVRSGRPRSSRTSATLAMHALTFRTARPSCMLCSPEHRNPRSAATGGVPSRQFGAVARDPGPPGRLAAPHVRCACCSSAAAVRGRLDG